MTIICIGEALIELVRGADGRFVQGCGGDAFATAIYLARAGQEVAFATAVGEDPYSDGIVALAAAEGISPDLILRKTGRVPGLCLIDGDANGLRRRHYWREASAASELFEREGWDAVAEAMMQAQMIYLTGITLSLYSNAGIGRLLAVAELARQKGAKVAFDVNFRPHLWRGDLGRARAAVMEALKRTDIALPAFDDEAVLWGDPSPEATVSRLQAFGIGEIVVKNGPNRVLVVSGESREFVPVPAVLSPVDMAAAGDGFNAGYLAARLDGEPPIKAAEAAHRLAATVIGHPGSIIPRADAAMH